MSDEPKIDSLFSDKPSLEDALKNSAPYLTFDNIKNSLLKKNYMFFDNGNYNLNFIWIRMDEIITNYFTDKLAVLYRLNGEEQILLLPATTKPGIKGSIDSPITYEGITGTAIIIPNQYRSSWQFTDSYTAFSKYPYFCQCKGISYWRDGDKDLVVDEVQEQDNKIFGTHWHRMSNIGITGYPVNQWSLGCMGVEEPNWKKVVELTRQAVLLWGTIFTGTIINFEDLI